MTLAPSHQEQRDCVEIWTEYVSRFPWQWAATFSFEYGTNYFVAQKKFIKWRFKLIDEEKLRVGAYIMSSSKKRKLHFHGLLLGRNRHGKTLMDCDCRKWRNVWFATNRTDAKVKPVYNLHGACAYQAMQYLGFKADFAEPEPFDLDLLQDVMEIKNDGLDFLEKL